MENSQQTCPTEEQLSEFYDLLRDECHEDPLVVQLKDHVAHCVRCQAILEAYGKMDECVSVALSHSAPEALAERICLECHRVAADDAAVAATMPAVSGTQSCFARYKWYKWFGAAAVIGIFAGAVVSFWRQSPSSSSAQEYDTALAMHSPRIQPAVEKAEAVNMGEEAEVPAVKLSSADKAPTVADTAATSSEAEKMTPALSAGVQTKDLQNVGTRNRKADARYANVTKRRLSDVVRHVWTVDDLESCRNTLKSLEINDGVKVLFDDGEQGKIVAVIEGISDRQLQQLVDKFDDFKWALVSPKLPQPKQPDYVAFENRQVIYSFCAVKSCK